MRISLSSSAAACGCLALASSAGLGKPGESYSVEITGIGGGSYVNGSGGGGGPCSGPLCIIVPISGSSSVNGGGPEYPPCQDPGCPGCCPAKPPRIRVEILNCNGDSIGNSTVDVPLPSCADNPTTPGVDPQTTVPFDLDVSVEVCGGVPKRVRIVPIKYEWVFLGYCDEQWTEQPPIEGPALPPPSLDCTLSKDALACLACSSPPDRTNGRVTLFKGDSVMGSERKVLYSLPADDGSQATFGETVNGRYEVEGPGQLSVLVKNTGTAVSVYGAPTVGAGGWYSGSDLSGRGGTPITDDALNVACGASGRLEYPFNARTLHGEAPGFDLEFHWLTWSQDGCCVHHEVEGLNAEVIPLVVLPSGELPLVPGMRKSSGQFDDGHVELRLPRCGTCEEAACPPGNLTDWFVVWPAGYNGEVVDGHAKGWKVYQDGVVPGTDVLAAPEPGSVVYRFDTVP